MWSDFRYKHIQTIVKVANKRRAISSLPPTWLHTLYPRDFFSASSLISKYSVTTMFDLTKQKVRRSLAMELIYRTERRALPPPLYTICDQLPVSLSVRTIAYSVSGASSCSSCELTPEKRTFNNHVIRVSLAKSAHSVRLDQLK